MNQISGRTEATIDVGTVAPIIDRRYPLGEVPEALRYLEAGHAHGKVVTTVSGSGDAG